jgi:hypothetical protein
MILGRFPTETPCHSRPAKRGNDKVVLLLSRTTKHRSVRRAYILPQASAGRHSVLDVLKGNANMRLSTFRQEIRQWTKSFVITTWKQICVTPLHSILTRHRNCHPLADKVPQGKPTKGPYRVNGFKASPTDPTTWSPYQQVLVVLQQNPDRFNGIGFVFTEYDPFAGIDLIRPNCRGLAALAGWARGRS